MACRVGVDLVAVDQVAHSIERFGDRYLCRVYTDRERADCAGGALTMAASLAARFAAKEAALKVLRPPGARPGWRTIEVRRTPGGWCELHLDGSAARLAAEEGLAHWSVCLTHEGNGAAAVVAAIQSSILPGNQLSFEPEDALWKS